MKDPLVVPIFASLLQKGKDAENYIIYETCEMLMLLITYNYMLKQPRFEQLSGFS